MRYSRAVFLQKSEAYGQVTSGLAKKIVMTAGSEVSTYLPFAGKDKIAKFLLFRLQADERADILSEKERNFYKFHRLCNCDRIM